MNNNLILEAEELFKKFVLTDDHMLFVEALNKISVQIGTAISPLTKANRPFIAAVMMRYVDFIKKDFDTNEMEVFHEMLRGLGNTGAEYIVIMPMPTKGEKPNG